MALAIVLAHPAIALVDNPAIVGLLDLRSAPWHMTAGVISAVALVALVLVSLARRRLRIPCESWRTTHVLLSVSTVGFAFAHIHGVQ